MTKDTGGDAPKKSGRRDELLAIQATAQKKWEELKVFEVDAPKGGEPVPEGKFFGNFPYPYMNGVLHLGHAFSISKLEFASAYHRLIGKRVLFPQGFHCTGMPIKACADRLKNETELYGAPPVIPDEEPEPEAEAPAEAAGSAGGEGAKKKTKGKVAAKKAKGTTQWDILKNSGIPEEDIPKFQDPLHWLEYFPPIAKADMTYLGCGVDWRRSFITTDVNPYYDSFVRWQLTTLKNQGKVVKDKRFAVYSPKDGQPCADHDRASGEGVGPQEYTLVKMKALELRGPLAELAHEKVPGCEVFFMAATLRPETMYGQTNCWVLPDGDYVAAQGPGKAVYVMCERAARNLAFQDQMPEAGKVNVLVRCKGQDLIGTPLAAPNCAHERIYVLPLLTILMTKGTGVVTSVPSDSPTDYMALQDLKKKEKFREKFAVEDDWVLPFEVVPIIDIPGFGDKSAVKVCEDLKIQSQNDTVKLEEAKGMVYLKGFNEGTMTVGKYQGEPVSEAKPKLRQDMLDSGDAIVYAEPENRVISRSQDECVVALTDQWYIIYGEEEWRKKTEEALERMNLYDETVLHSFQHTLGWLNQWACSRSFGLGTRVPWDPEFLIESLSDSTVYMAFYTVAHILQEGDMFGKKQDAAVHASYLTHEVWDAILLDKPVPKFCSVPEDKMQAMKDEFKFWYPFDLRVSGKDLIQNHLTFCLYNHTAIFPESKWPKAMRTNGHLQLNSEKMSKSTGNFLTLRQAVDQYSADAIRVALADSSDTNDDGNCGEDTANAAILRLTKELAWINESKAPSTALRTGERNLADKVFSNAISCAAHAARTAYDSMLFREALKASMYELQNARDAYRVQLGADGMHKEVLDEYLDVGVRTLAPICPHWSEHVWGEVLGKEGSVLTSGWPQVAEPDFMLKMAAEFIEKLVGQLKSAIAKKEAPQKKKKDAGPPPKVTGLKLQVAEKFEGWRALGLAAARDVWDEGTKKLPDGWMTAACAAAGKDESLAGMNEKGLKGATMPFLKMKGQEAEQGGKLALEDKAPFNELQVLNDYLPHLNRSLGLDDITAHAWPAGETIDAKEGPFPLQPLVILTTAEAPAS